MASSFGGLRQLAWQPSPSVLLLSSHSSPAPRTPSPQNALLQSVRQVLGSLLRALPVALLVRVEHVVAAARKGAVGTKTPSPHFERILFYVDADAKRAGLVHRVLIVDSAGNRNRIDFQAPKFNRTLGDKIFGWQPPKGTRRITQ